MTNNIPNGLNQNYNKQIYSINQTPKEQKPVEALQAEQVKQINEIPSAINVSAIKVPLSYTKTGEKELPYGIKAHFYKLSNGQKVVILPKEGKTVLRSYVNTGSLNEPDNVRGISHYIEHNLFNGSEGLGAGEFFATTDKMGADTNASTGMAETNYYIASHLLNEGDLEQKIKIHASMLETPKFAVDMLEKEKGIVNAEINLITSNPENIAFNHTIKKLFNIKSSSEDVIAGTTNNITNLTQKDVVDYFNKNYYPGNIVTVVSGEVNPDETMKMLSKYFKSGKTPPVSRYYEPLSPITKTIREDVISDKASSPFLVMGFAGPKNNDTKENIYLAALSRLMFSSSSAEKVFHPINASVGASSEKVSSNPNAPTALMIAGDTSEENSELMLRKVYSQVQKYQNTLVSQEDMEIVKRDMKKHFAHLFESSFAINSFIGSFMLVNGVDDINNYEKIIDNMTPQDLQNAARKYFNLNKAAITMIHPGGVNSEKLNENYKKSQNINFTGAMKKQAFDIDNVKQYKLPNNYKVTTYNSTMPDVDINLLLKPESPVIAKNPAAYSVLNEILKNGTSTKDLPEFLRELEKSGSDMGISVNRYGITAEFTADNKDFDKSAAIFNEYITNPRFTQETFDKAVADVRDVLLRKEKSPYNKLKPELDKNSHTAEEVLNGLETIKLDDVKQLYSQIVNSSRGIASVSAPLETNPDLRNKIFGSLASLAPVKEYKPVLVNDYSPVEKTKVLTETDNKSFSKIVMAYKFPRNGNIKDETSIKLMNIILGDGPSSRLFNDLRESQKLAYAVKSSVSERNSTGTMELVISTTTDNKVTGEQSFDNLQKSINGFKNNINKITGEKVSQEELEKAKLALKNSILSVNEETFGKNLSILTGSANWYGANYYNKLLDTIDSITVDDIYNSANHVFNGKPLYSIVATKDTLDYNKEYLDSLEKI